jgi:non-lysosomal glucosylceramidase
MGGDVDAYGYLAYNRFFPSIERDRLRAMAEAIMLDPSGDPTDPTANGDPYVAWQPGSAPVPGASDYLDIPSKRIYRMYAYASLNHDPAFLRQAYPAMKKELAWVQGMIPAGQVLPVGAQPPGNSFLPLTNTYDVIPVLGADAYDSMLYLLALEVMIASGSRLGESRTVISGWQDQLNQAKAAFETTFWDPQNNWYKYTEYASGSAVLLDTFYAQHVAEQFGLPDLVDLSHYRAQLEGTYGIFMSHRDSGGNLIGAYNLGLPEGVTTYPLIGYLFGSPETPTQEHMIWVGANFFTGATYINAGKRFGSRALQADGIQMASAVANQVWGILDNGLAFDAPECWTIDGGVANILYPGYERPIAIWDTFNALDPFFPPRVP